MMKMDFSCNLAEWAFSKRDMYIRIFERLISIISWKFKISTCQKSQKLNQYINNVGNICSK